MASGRRIRILIVDDSAVMRSLLRTVIVANADPNADPNAGLEVAGTAADGASALSAVESLRPDLILLDVEMPVMNGLETLRKLRSRGHKMPVIMCSSLTQRGARVTIEALASGASDYVAKPTGQASREAASQALAQELLPKIHALTSQQMPPPQPIFAPSPRPPLFAPTPQPLVARSTAPLPNAVPKILAIGVSTGGPAALDQLLPTIPASFPLPIVIVQHMPELFTRLLAERLNGRCKLQVREAAEGELVQAGKILIAKGNWHMEVLSATRTGMPPSLHLTQAAPENHCRPAVDVLFRSVVPIYGSGVLAVVLTGMGSDGLIGSRLIRENGGCILAQDQASSTVWGMPGAVVTAGVAHKVLSLNAMVPEILRLVSRSHNEARELRESVA